jgi:hypothetical protein
MEESNYYRFKLKSGNWCIAKRIGDLWRVYGTDYLSKLKTINQLNLLGALGENIQFPK